MRRILAFPLALLLALPGCREQLIRPDDPPAPDGSYVVPAAPVDVAVTHDVEGGTLTELPTGGLVDIFAAQLSEGGHVKASGRIDAPDVSFHDQHGYFWSAETGVRVVGSRDTDTRFFDVRDDGAVVGMEERTPLFWTADGGVVEIPMPPSWTDGKAAAFAPDGRVLGVAEDAEGRDVTWIWSDASPGEPAGRIAPLPDLFAVWRTMNAEGVYIAFDGQVWKYPERQKIRDLQPLPGHESVFLYDLNDHGVVVGASHSNTSVAFEPVLWPPEGEPVRLGIPCGDRAQATGINNHGVVVGSCGTISTPRRPWVWTEAGGFILLPILPEFRDASAGRVNDRGQILGGMGPWHDRRLVIWDVELPEEPSRSVEILEVRTRHRSRSDAPTFTTLPSEAEIEVEADVRPATRGSEVQWEVRSVNTKVRAPVVPTASVLPQGEEITWTVPPQNAFELESYPHPGTVEEEAFKQKALTFEIVAFLEEEDGERIEAEPDTVRQDEVDTVREEYIELRHARGVPLRTEFEVVERRTVGQNTGDYGIAVVNDAFVIQLQDVRQQFGAGRPWQVNSIYRNPVHQRIHLNGDPDSFHQDGCAVDLQTFPARGADEVFDSETDSLRALKYWLEVVKLGRRVGLQFEALEDSEIGHVHLERDPCLVNYRPIP